MATKTKNDDLLGSLSNDSEPVDLLDEIDAEDGATAWTPEKPGDGIQGRVVARSEIRSDYEPYQMCPVVVLETADGEKRRIVGYAGVLAKQITEKDPQPGDTFAVKYFGKQANKKGNDYHNYGSAVRKGAGAPATKTPPF